MQRVKIAYLVAAARQGRYLVEVVDAITPTRRFAVVMVARVQKAKPARRMAAVRMVRNSAATNVTIR